MAYTDRPVAKAAGEWRTPRAARTLSPVGRMTSLREATMSDEASPEQMENGLAFKRAMGLLAAVGVAAAIGLATVDTIDTDSGERALPTDASAQRGPGY